MSVTLHEVFNFWIERKQSNTLCTDMIAFFEENTGCNFESDKIKSKVLRLCRTFKLKWEQSFRKKDVFKVKNMAWLESVIDLSGCLKVGSIRNKFQIITE